jgi:hypothetical protein
MKQTLVSTIELGRQGQVRIPAARLGKYQHPIYGVLDLNRGLFDSFIKNWRDRVVGYDLALDPEHQPGLGALAWLTDVTVENGGLVLYGNPTPTGKAQLGTSYKYASLEFTMDYKDPKGQRHGPTLLGCAATNRPFVPSDQEIAILSAGIERPEFVFDPGVFCLSQASTSDRSKRYDIRIRKDARAKVAGTRLSQYGDPVNFLYLIRDETEAGTAKDEFAKETFYTFYEKKTIRGRINRLCRKYGVDPLETPKSMSLSAYGQRGGTTLVQSSPLQLTPELAEELARLRDEGDFEQEPENDSPVVVGFHY